MLPLMERWGRRPIMFWGAFGCTIAMAIFTAMNGLPDSEKTDATQWTAVVFVLIYLFIFGFAWVGVPWLVR